MDILQQVKATIRKHRMLEGGEKVLVGLSGGPDSVCLLWVLRALRQELGLQGLWALYVEHGIRPRQETQEEVAFCQALCQALELPFEHRVVDVPAYAKAEGLSLQEAARVLRHQALQAHMVALKAHRVALGHNADDQVETFLMNLLRGSGARGLTAIPPVRGHIIRPLIETPRATIEAFLQERGIGYLTDPSNLKQRYLRNRIRRELIPVLRRFNPRLTETVLRSTELLSDEERYLESTTLKALMRLICRRQEGLVELFLSPLESLDRVLQRRALRHALQATKGLRNIQYGHIEEILRLIALGSPGDRLYLPGGVRVIRQYATVLITTRPPVRLAEHTLEVPGEVGLPEAGLRLRASLLEAPPPEWPNGRKKAPLDAELLSPPLLVRSRRPGDFFCPAGFGRRKKLQDFFVDEKIPRDERDAVPVVLSGSDIVWLAGLRADERFRAREGTKRFVLLELGP